MRLAQLLQGIEVMALTGDRRGEVAQVCYDSRQCRTGSLFVAIPGLKADGRAFIADALSRGAGFVVHEGAWEAPAGVTAIRVRDSRRTLGLLGKNLFGDPSSALCLIGVVGTNGKTTITYLLEAILQAAGSTVGVLGTVNYRYGDRSFPAPNTTPESFEMQRILREMVDHGVTHCVAEVSSHAIALHRVDDCSFCLGIFTNLTQDHLDYHKTMEAYFQAKRRFFAEVLPGQARTPAGRMIVNGDDPWGGRMLEEIKGGIAYGLAAGSGVTAAPYRLSREGIEATLHLRTMKLPIRSPLMGRFNLYNILAAAAAAEALAIPGEAIRDGIAALGHVPGRLEKVSTAGQPAVFVDYAHTDDALRRVLENLSAFRTRRLITVFGCGGDRDRGKRPLMGEAATALSDLTFVTSDNPRSEDPEAIITEIEKGIAVPRFQDAAEIAHHLGQRGYFRLPDRREAIRLAIASAHREDIVLIAGKGHEDYQIIGSRRFSFDDRQVAREALAEWQGGALP
jgi:UDP-N-acetylmuramoyl-L-alanyl-D-glutamate--2,6-diaminopimelate ligase